MIRKFIYLFLVLCSFITSIENDLYKFPNLNYFPKMPENKENSVSNLGVELGRHLFYDSILSKNYNMSCASCHKQEFAFSDGFNAFSKGFNGKLTKRNTLPLFNLAWYDKLFWDGRANEIEEQIFHPVRDENELNLDWKNASKRVSKNIFYQQKFNEVFKTKKIDSILISKAIGQFLRTLLTHNSKYDLALKKIQYLNEDEIKGFELVNDMTKGSCLHCHTTDADALGTTRKFSNNGLDNVNDVEKFKDDGLGKTTKNKSDNGKFKIPSLRNLGFTAPYMHDGRFNTLEEVLDFYSEGVNKSINIDSKMEFAHLGGSHLSSKEKKEIIAFLNTLNDSTFIINPNFKNPFLRKKTNR